MASATPSFSAALRPSPPRSAAAQGACFSLHRPKGAVPAYGAYDRNGRGSGAHYVATPTVTGAQGFAVPGGGPSLPLSSGPPPLAHQSPYEAYYPRPER